MLVKKIFHLLKKDLTASLFFLLFCGFIFMGLVWPYLISSSPFDVNENFLNYPPFWMEGGSSQFLLGTDDLGRDFFTRLVYGAGISIQIGFLVVGMSLIVGVFLGLLGGYLGGRVDRFIMSFVDILMSFPSILTSILIVSVLGPGLMNVIIAVNVTAWPGFIRVVRSVVLREKQKDYIQAAKGFGAGKPRILILNLLPNCSGPIIVQSALGFSEGILNVAALGFLGLGAVPPTPEWGVMISDGRAYMETAWWLSAFPGFFLLMFVLSVNVMAESLRDVLDPKT